MSTFERNISPKIQTELTNREILSDGRPRRFAGDTGDSGNITFADMASRTTYSMMVTNYGHSSQNINKGIAGGEFFENRNEDGSAGTLFETLNGFRTDGVGSYRETAVFDNKGDVIEDDSGGIRPVCGIKSITMEFLNANGVRKATVNWSAPSIDSLEEFKDFLRVGTAVALQFGWVWPTRNDLTVDNTTFIYLNRETNRIEVDQTILKNPYDGITASKGNMDALGGFVSNFSSKLRDDGGFDCETIITGFGISFLEDVGAMESGAEITLKLQDEVRNAIQDYTGNYSDVVNTIGDSLRNAGIFSGEEGQQSLVEAIAYNDLYHAILNLDSICSALMVREEEGPDFTQTLEEKMEDLETSFLPDDEFEEAMEEYYVENQEDIDEQTDRMSQNRDDLTGQAGGGATVGVDGGRKVVGDATTAMFNIDSFAANMFSVSKETSIGNRNRTKDSKINERDIYVRWGWFEDNILSKYLALVDDSNQIILDFRSIQGTKGNEISNYIAYNQEMKPKDFSKVFWASSNWSFNAADFDDSINNKPATEKFILGFKRYNRTGEVFTIGKTIELLNELNQTISAFREFQDDQNPKFGRVRNMFVNVSAIQEAFGFDTSIRTVTDNSGFLKSKPKPTTLRSAIEKLLSYLQDSLYNVPDLLLESESSTYSVIDKTIEGSGNTKSYTTKDNKGQILKNGLFKFESFSKNSIVKNQNLEFNIPDKLGSAAFLNGGGNLSTKGNTEEENFSKIIKADGFAANSFLSNIIKNPKSGVSKANPKRELKTQKSEKFIYYGGVIDLKDWKKIPLKSNHDKNVSSDELSNEPVTKEGINVDPITNEIYSIAKNENGEPIRKTVEESAMYIIDHNRDNNWLEAIKLDSKYEPLIRRIFTQTGVSATQSVKDPLQEWANLSMDIDGIGGLRPRTMLNVSYLPRKYNMEIFRKDTGESLGPSFYFNIDSLTQKIDDSGWTTSFETYMRINDVAYDYAREEGLFNTTNAINSISRQFKQSKPESLVDKLKKILEPLAKAKAKFDEFMAGAEEYQLKLQSENPNNRAKPFGEAYQNYQKKKEDDFLLNDFADSELDNMLIGLDEVELFDVDESGDIAGFETEVYGDEDKEKFAGVRGLLRFFRDAQEVASTGASATGLFLSEAYGGIVGFDKPENFEQEQAKSLSEGDSSSQTTGNKELDLVKAEEVKQDDKVSTFFQITKALQEKAKLIANQANDIAQTEIDLITGGSEVQRSEKEAQKVLDRLAVSEDELIDKVNTTVTAGEVVSVGTLFSKKYSGSGTAVTFDFDNEEEEITFTLEETKGVQTFTTQEQAQNSDESVDFKTIIKNNLIIAAEEKYNI